MKDCIVLYDTHTYYIFISIQSVPYKVYVGICGDRCVCDIENYFITAQLDFLSRIHKSLSTQNYIFICPSYFKVIKNVVKLIIINAQLT